LSESQFSAGFRARFPAAFSRGIEDAISADAIGIESGSGSGLAIGTEVIQDGEDDIEDSFDGEFA
jgi:hypothetical protein